jgi:signal transduction histidine kinase
MTPTPTGSSASDARRGVRLRLQHRIVIAVVLVALITSGGAAWVAVRVTTDAFRSRLQTQLAGSASAVSTVGLALNPGILRTLSGIVGAQIVTLGPDGSVLASSAENLDERLLAALRQAAAVRGPARRDAAVADCGFPCLVAVRDVEGRSGAVVALAVEMSALDAATSSVARAILLSALISVVLLVLVMQAVVRRLTVPLDRLVQFARERSPADSRRAVVGDDEVGELSDAFNSMLDRLDAAQAAAVRSEKLGLTGLFAARVAHDIRNPLASIKLQAQLLRAQAKDGEVVSTLTGVLRDIDQVESVVGDLMELARPGDLRRERVALNDVVRDALQHVGPQFAYRKIQVEERLAEGLPLVSLDRTRFKQALLNVLVNASEAMPTGGHVEVSTAREGQWVSVEVCDDGVGIPAELTERVFEPFVSTKREGVGLGLVNVKAVVGGHGGRITLAPRQPRGTRARISLPVNGHG